MKTIMVMFDSLNRALLSPYGCDWTVTPNFARLAQRAVTFEKNYSGSLPCMPARRELHTGRYNFLHRSWGPIEPFDDSMPEILKNNGVYSHLVSDHCHYWEDGGATYHTRYNSWEILRGQEGDKWKVLPELFHDAADFESGDAKYFKTTADLHRHDRVNRKFEDTEEKMPIARTFACGMEFIEANHSEDKWFLQIESFDPHEPFFSCEEYKKLYPHDYDGPEYDWPPYHHVTESEATQQHLKCSYTALLSMCDAYLGRLLDQMDRLDMWKDTMLIVCTDHGYLLGEHGWWSKTVMPVYEEICHTPLFVYDPRFKCGGQRRSAITQFIDLPATVLEFFGIERPRDMQGKPLRSIIENENTVTHEYALFGFFNSHVNITDGTYVYMKAPVDERVSQTYEYTLMPTHMRSRFSADELKDAQLSAPFGFSKDCPLLKVPCAINSDSENFCQALTDPNSAQARHMDSNNLVYAANFGDKLFNISTDPKQQTQLKDEETEAAMANLLVRAMKENDCPPEQYVRIGLSADVPTTPDDIRRMRESYERSRMPDILVDREWSASGVIACRSLLRFFTPETREAVSQKIEDALSAQQGLIDAQQILGVIDILVDEEKAEMLRYFVGMAARVS